MTGNQFEVFVDPLGNIYCRPGVAIDLGATTTAYFRVAQEIVAFERTVEDISPSFDPNLRSPTPYSFQYMGGSGQSMQMAGTLSLTFAPTGNFRRIGKYEWISQYGQTIDFDPTTGDADLLDTDGTTILATFSDPSATLAPVGTFSSTVDGENIYNGGSAFTLTATYDGVAESTSASVILDPTIAPVGVFPTIQEGIYSFSSGDWISDDDANWSITIDSSGNAEISDGTDVIAERLLGDLLNPSGEYESTTYGENTYNDDIPFVVTVGIDLVSPMTGYVYAKFTMSSGRITSAEIGRASCRERV